MTIFELGAIGEFVGAFLLFGSLVFVGLQMRQNTKVLIRTNSRQAFLQNGQALQAILDKEVSEIFLRGHNEGLSSLTTEERYRFDLAFTLWFQSVEQVFSDHREGLFPPDQIEVFRNSVAGWLDTPGGADWWHEREVWFGQKFREEVEEVLNNPSLDATRAGPPRQAQ